MTAPHFYTLIPARPRKPRGFAAPRVAAGGANEEPEQASMLDDPEIAAIHARVEASMLRCLRAILVRIGRDYERCGKAACARARRCRGLACEPAVADDEDDE